MTRLYLTTQPDPAPGMAGVLGAVLAGIEIAAVRISRGTGPLDDYLSYARQLIPAIQRAKAAALLDGLPDHVVALGADGVHLEANGLVQETIGELKPNFIVGVGEIASRHEAMTLGEAGVDYLMFGDLAPRPDMPDLTEIGAAELARWWVENFQVPAVWQSRNDDMDPQGCEFLAMGPGLWNRSDPAEWLAGNVRAGQ